MIRTTTTARPADTLNRASRVRVARRLGLGDFAPGRRLARDGDGPFVLGTLYAASELARLPAAVLLPAVLLRCGARRR